MGFATFMTPWIGQLFGDVNSGTGTSGVGQARICLSRARDAYFDVCPGENLMSNQPANCSAGVVAAPYRVNDGTRSADRCSRVATPM